jgi:hypothetical protein
LKSVAVAFVEDAVLEAAGGSTQGPLAVDTTNEESAMGDVIRRNAAVEDIFADITTALVRARAKGETWQELAEGQIAQVVTLIEENRTRRAAAETHLTARQAVADAAATHASLLLGKVSDDI